MSFETLPKLPASHVDLPKYISRHQDRPIVDIIEPYRRYESELRTVFAQDRTNPALDDPYLNVLPLFNENTKEITTRARDLSAETDDEKSKYVMPLPEDKRRPHGSPATVSSISEFQKNFSVFSESSLVDLDWNNVVAAGSSVVNCLLPVPKEFNTTKRKLREYYHEKFCPASDVDLFLYGLTHDEAIDKIKQIEKSIRDALLNEVVVVRTKYALTIASQYPVRHVQIVLRVYKSISEILTGFDIDAAGGAYDGNQVFVTPRALGSFITQINHIDLSRRSPSYESRLSKYSHRNFEVYWHDLDRTRIDPTIFERSFKRTLGLARLLVLERLPTTSAREAYLNKRRQERGRPTIYRGHFTLGGNIKDIHEDEVADWLSEEEVSNYHTFTVPYGQHFNAKRIEKLCYTRDLLLNAEWNQPKDREVYLHRHPAFFGRVEDVIEDCCGSCPKPITPDEVEVAEKEKEIYISGNVAFLIDDPGRQQIGSFNPLTEQDWTDMAYVGNTARLCQSVVDADVDDVLDWLSEADADPNQRDYTGRSPLHLAVMASTPEVVKCLIDSGARLTARLADGRTALHLAASRGNTEMIKILMEKSIENEEAEEERKDKRRQAAKVGNVDKNSAPESTNSEEATPNNADEDSDGELIDGDMTDTDAASMTTGSFIKVKKGEHTEDLSMDESDDEADYYHIDILAWDVPCSPLHLAIAGGHEDAVKALCDVGADSILPVKFLSSSDENETAAILTLTLTLALPLEQAVSMAKLLLKLGAISSQAEHNGTTAFHRFMDSGKLEMIETLLEHDKAGVKTALNHLVFSGHYWRPEIVAPIHSAILHGDSILTLKLLNAGASPEIDFETWLKAAKFSPNQASRLSDLQHNQESYKQMEQPLVTAVRCGNPEVAMTLLQKGADPNTLTPDTHNLLRNEYNRRWSKGMSVLDLVQKSIRGLTKERDESCGPRKPEEPPGMDAHLEIYAPGTYKHWVVSQDVASMKKSFEKQMQNYEKEVEKYANDGEQEKKRVLDGLITGLKKLKAALIAKGGKTFAELWPHIKTGGDSVSTFTKSHEEPMQPYHHLFSFSSDKDLTEKRKEGYIELMEAAWAGDLERIKALTLQAWGPDQDQPPLKMAISDHKSNSPFSLAFLGGHLEIAKVILEITKAQWSPTDNDKVRYKMAVPDREDEYSDDDRTSKSGRSDDGEPRIVVEKVDKKFTIDNIGQISMQVQSSVKPLTSILQPVLTFIKEDGVLKSTGQRSLFVHCFDTDDQNKLKVLLDWAENSAAQKFDGDDEEFNGSFTFPQDDFQWAVRHGKPQLLGLVIKRTGAGIPLDHLVKKSGVEIKQKPKYYQGLTVYGRKRKDWATAGRNMVSRSIGSRTPPLLYAALGGRVESAEFFLSDAPHRMYAEFAKSKSALENFRLQHLKESPGGFDRAISKWLGADNDLVIHCTVLATPGQQANELLDYLIQTCPSALEKKTSNGDTPLMVACRLGRTQFVRILVEGKADQSTRNSKGENIIHMALAGNPTAHHRLRGLLDMLDPELRGHLFLQRKNLSENGTTPFQSWISQVCGSLFQPRHHYYSYETPAYERRKTDMVDVLNLLLEYSNGGQGLDMLNGAGDTCLHTAIMRGHIAIAKVLIDFKPSLLYRENAVGRTPAEVAYDNLTSYQLAKPERIYLDKNNGFDKIARKSLDSFAQDAQDAQDAELKANELEVMKAKLERLGLSGDYKAKELRSILGSMGLAGNSAPDRVDKALIVDLCKTAMRKHPRSRRLVSLNEANDVARRLGEQETRSRYFSVQTRKDDDGDEDADDQEDKSMDDFAVKELAKRLNSAWTIEQDEEIALQRGLEKCSGCEKYHD